MNKTSILKTIEHWKPAQALITPYGNKKDDVRFAIIRDLIHTSSWHDTLFRAALLEERDIYPLQALIQLQAPIKTVKLLHHIFHRCSQEAGLVAITWEAYPQYRQTLLHSCIKYGSATDLDLLLSMHADTNSIRSKDIPHLVLRLNEASCVERQRIWDACPRLHQALVQSAQTGNHIEVLAWMSQYEPVEISYRQMHDALWLASSPVGLSEAACLRLLNSINPSLESGNCKHYLVADATNAAYHRLIRALKEAGYSMDVSNGSYPSPLNCAVLKEDLKTLELLLRLGADANGHPDTRATPLQEALSAPGIQERYKLTDLLLQYGADPMQGNPKPLELAKNLEDSERIQHLLIEFGAREPIEESSCCGLC